MVSETPSIRESPRHTTPREKEHHSSATPLVQTRKDARQIVTSDQQLTVAVEDEAVHLVDQSLQVVGCGLLHCKRKRRDTVVRHSVMGRVLLRSRLAVTSCANQPYRMREMLRCASL